jgi:hypothetical protein
MNQRPAVVSQAGGLQPAAQIEVSLSGEPNQVRVFGGASAYGRLLLGFRA